MAKPQIINDEQGRPAFAVIPWDVWERVRPYAEDDSDEALFDAAIARKSETFPAKVVDAILEGTSPVKAFRQHRGLTQAVLAKKAGITPLYLSQIETGRRTGSLETLRALAKALGLDVTLLLPTS
ncbi:MAG: helix-turn-helix transcriptional regulator [Magnetospirillum sp. WYHS-4]